jgi:hypothetical protein
MSFMSSPTPGLPATNGATPLASPDSIGSSLCANCGATVSGAYCSACGQRVQHHVPSLAEFLGEAAEVFTHADSRLWRTFVPLLFRPGFLTQQFLRGRRASYLPPFRLYIVVSLLFFLVFSLTAQVSTHTTISSNPGRDAGSQGLADIQREFDESTDPEERALLRSQLQRMKSLNDKLAPTAEVTSCSERIHVSSVSSWLQRGLVAACEKTKADQRKELERNLIHNLGRAMFLFLPLLAVLMKLLYLRQKRYYVEHLLLLLHNHAFAFLIMSVFMVATHFMSSHRLIGGLRIALSIYVTYYLYRSIRRVYGQGRTLTLLKFATLAFGYLVCGVFMLMLTAVYSAVTL